MFAIPTSAVESIQQYRERDEAFGLKDYEVSLAMPSTMAMLLPQFLAVAEAGDADAALWLARDVAEAARLLDELKEARLERHREKFGECPECQTPLSDDFYAEKRRPFCSDPCKAKAKERQQADREAAALAREREAELARLPLRVERMERRELAAQLSALRIERRLASRKRVPYTGPARPGFVYRLFDASGALLYVGKTYNVRARLFTGPTAHSVSKKWFSEVALVKVAAYKTEDAALEAEAWAIKREAPLHNVAAPLPKKSRAPRPVAVYEGAL